MVSLLLGLAVLACPVGMGVMMWMMMGRRRSAGANDGGGAEQVAALRAEIDDLKTERATRDGA